MPTLKVAFNKTTKVATVLDASGSVPSGSVAIGTFEHPDATYPDSLVIYHGVRDLLYKSKKDDPGVAGFWPDNYSDMQAVTITNSATPRMIVATPLPHVVSTIEGKDVFFHVDIGGGKAPITYAWQFKAMTAGADWVDIDDGENESAATATLINHAVTAASAGYYKVIATDANGTTAESETQLAVGAYPPPALTGITPTPASLTLSVAADATNGKTVSFAAVPLGATLGTLTIKTAPTAGRATATIAGNVLTVKPVAAGAATSVVVTNGTIDVTIAVTVAA